jgi:hypothetical protein
MSEFIWIVILAGIVSANLPFISDKFLFIFQIPNGKKHAGWCLLELIIWMTLVFFLGFWLEGRLGNVFPKRWEFFAIFICLFLVAAFPGFVWRFLRKSRR